MQRSPLPLNRRSSCQKRNVPLLVDAASSLCTCEARTAGPPAGRSDVDAAGCTQRAGTPCFTSVRITLDACCQLAYCAALRIPPAPWQPPKGTRLHACVQPRRQADGRIQHPETRHWQTPEYRSFHAPGLTLTSVAPLGPPTADCGCRSPAGAAVPALVRTRLCMSPRAASRGLMDLPLKRAASGREDVGKREVAGVLLCL